MGETTNISWADSTWNPWVGCHHAGSPGCDHCYARVQVNRFGDFEKRRRTAPQTFNAPLRWNKKPLICDQTGEAFNTDGFTQYAQGFNSATVHRRRIFSLSLGDWLDPEVPVEYLADALDVIRRCPDCDVLLLTKRPELWKSRLMEVDAATWGHPVNDFARQWLLSAYPHNIWIGTTVENQAMADKRIPELMKIPARVRFLSCEPLLSSINFHCAHGFCGCDTPKIAWAIIGCESGPHRRNQTDYAEHARYIIEQCQAAKVPVFHKQMPVNGRVSHDMAEWPEDLRIRETPNL